MKIIKKICIVLFVGFPLLLSAQVVKRIGIQNYPTASSLQSETLIPNSNDKVYIISLKGFFSWENANVSLENSKTIIKQASINTGRWVADGSVGEIIDIKNREIFEVVKATSDGQTVFQSTIMPTNYNKNRLVIEIQNGDLKLTKEDGYTYNTATQTLTLTLTGFTLETNNEIRFCFY